jgi:hypothetical protein
MQCLGLVTIWGNAVGLIWSTEYCLRLRICSVDIRYSSVVAQSSEGSGPPFNGRIQPVQSSKRCSNSTIQTALFFRYTP